jgi:hypothetical protein
MFLGIAFSGTVAAMPTTCKRETDRETERQRERERMRDLGVYMNL